MFVPLLSDVVNHILRRAIPHFERRDAYCQQGRPGVGELSFPSRQFVEADFDLFSNTTLYSRYIFVPQLRPIHRESLHFQL